MAQTHQIEALTAAAERIDVTRRDLKIRPRAWQQQFWIYYDEVEIVRYAARYMSNSIGRLKPLVAGRIEESNVPLNPEDPAEGFNPNDIRTADAILKALTNPHGLAEVLRGISLNLFGTGECWLVGRPSETDPNETMWDVCSVEQITSDSDGVKYRESTGQTMGVLLPEETTALRIWLRHPRWPKDPDSPNRSCLNILKELLLLTDLIEATAMSRIPAGMLFVPDSFEVLSANPEDKNQSFMQRLIDHMSTPVENSKAASRLVPFVVRGPGDEIEKVKDIDFSRDIDKLAIELRQELRERYAAGVDLPPEILTGKGDTNHWQAWNIDENAYSNHIAPLASVISEALTLMYLQPGLQAAGVEQWQQYVMDFDDSDLVMKPDQTDTIEWAHEAFLMSDEAARRELNIAESDAPEPDEIALRVERAIALARKSSVETTGGPMAEGEPDTEDEVTAAADSEQIDLAEWESTLRLRLVEQADAAMTRALEKAAARLRTELRNSGQTELIAAAKPIDNDELTAEMPELIAAIGSTPEELLAESFSGYLNKWDKLTGEAQQRLLNLARDGLTESEYSEASDILNEHRGTARTLLLAALITLATELIYNPHPQAPEFGEFDPNLKVQPGLIRGSLGLAGGAAIDLKRNKGGGHVGIGGLMVGGFYTSPDAYSIYGKARNLEFGETLIWHHGMPQRPFPPHERLDGKKFKTRIDPLLAARGGFMPSGGFYYPGDHDYCTCDIEVKVRGVPYAFN